ncbi:Aspartate aminotransferase [Klebsiella pneumoniae]|nr:Aspartate aminotransferase [Klebsiella pneumoniae]
MELDPHSEVAVFQGSHIGIGGIPRALLSPGQYLISTDPCYPIYRSAALQSQAAFYGLPLRAENHFLPDFNDLPREVADKAGLVVLNYPHNPTGALATPALFASALQFARRHQVPILHDFCLCGHRQRGQRCAAEPLLPARRQSMGSGNLYFFQDL